MPATALRSFEAQVAQALEHINVPSYLIDAAGVVRWVNAAGRRLVGDVEGRQFTSVVAPEESLHARELFARRLLGSRDSSDRAITLVDSSGERVAVEVSSVPLERDEHVVGVFGQVSDVLEEPRPTRSSSSRRGRPRFSACSSVAAPPTRSRRSST